MLWDPPESTSHLWLPKPDHGISEVCSPAFAKVAQRAGWSCLLNYPKKSYKSNMNFFFPNAIPPCKLQLKSLWRHHSKQEMILSSIITKLRTSNMRSQLLWFTHQKIKIAAILNYTANINFLSEHKLCLLLFTEQNQYNEPTCTKKDLSVTTISRSLKPSHALIYSHCCSELVSGNFYKYTTQQEPWDIQQMSLCYSHPFTNAWSDRLGGRPPSPCARAPSVPPPCPWPQEQQPHCHQSPLQLWKMWQEGVVGFILVYQKYFYTKDFQKWWRWDKNAKKKV